MAKKSIEINAWGIILIILGLIMYSITSQQSRGIGLLITTLGIIKLFGDILKNG